MRRYCNFITPDRLYFGRDSFQLMGMYGSGLVVSNDPAWLSAPTQASPPPGPAGFGQVTQSRMSPRAS